MDIVNLDWIDGEPVKERFFDLDTSVFLYQAGHVFGPTKLYFTDKDHWVVQVEPGTGVDPLKVGYYGFSGGCDLIKSGILRDHNTKTYNSLLTILQSWEEVKEEKEEAPPQRVKAFDLLRIYVSAMRF